MLSMKQYLVTQVQNLIFMIAQLKTSLGYRVNLRLAWPSTLLRACFKAEKEIKAKAHWLNTDLLNTRPYVFYI